MSEPIARREALRNLVVLSASMVVPGVLVGCSKKPSCEDISSLKPDEANVRTQTAAYQDTAADAAKKCNLCAQYVPAAPNQCGSCKVVKGPINPEGGCKLWVAKPA